MPANMTVFVSSYGVQLVTVWQDLAQLKEIYKGRWAPFINNSGIRAVFAVDEIETAEYWSKFLGSRLEDNYSAQVDIFGITTGGTQNQTMRPLMSPEEVMLQFARDRNRMLVLREGAHPVIVERVAYFNDAAYGGLSSARSDAPRCPAAAGGRTMRFVGIFSLIGALALQHAEVV